MAWGRAWDVGLLAEVAPPDPGTARAWDVGLLCEVAPPSGTQGLAPHALAPQGLAGPVAGPAPAP